MKKWILALIMCLALTGSALAVVNINTATKEELTSLKGIGDKRAQEIIDYRKKNGDFKSVDDLEKVPGIGPGIMKQIRSQVSTSGKTTIEKAGDKAKAADTTKSKSDAMKSEKAKAADTSKSKGADTKQGTASKGDTAKAEKTKEKVSEKSKADEKKTEQK
jgi:competence protein ComEA